MSALSLIDACDWCGNPHEHLRDVVVEPAGFKGAGEHRRLVKDSRRIRVGGCCAARVARNMAKAGGAS